jgi:chemosensory pili system protein ChpC
MNRQLIDAANAVDLITMLLPVKGKSLLLPNVSVAEIIHIAGLSPLDDVPTWFKGILSWRGYGIPVISFEAINEDPFAGVAADHRAAVINGSMDSARLPFYAIATQTAPRMMRITPQEIVKNTSSSKGPAELMVVSACGEQAAIPNLDFIESELLRVVLEAGCEIASAG